MTPFKLICGLVLIGALSACSKGEEQTTLLTEIAATAKTRFAKKEPAAAPPTLTRAALQQLDIPLLEATIENRGDTAYLAPQRQRNDSRPGALTVWRSGDDVTLTLRDGVLIATRGLRDDLLSASTLVTSGGAEGPSRNGPRRFVLHHGANQDIAFAFQCTQTRLGPETVDVLGKAYRTTHLRETCQGDDGQIQNDYWIDSQNGTIRQSRQWAGPTIGYIMLRVLEK